MVGRWRRVVSAWGSYRVLAGILALLVTLSALAVWYLAGEPRPAATVGMATWAGSASCAGCHANEHRAWSRSHHAKAMQHATPDTVLGDFSGVTHVHHGVRSRFFQRDGRFMVETDGPDGRAAEFTVLYTFGVEPLQQYLVELPGGRLQALAVGWDSRPRSQGGQRWFRQYPDERIDHRDELHWTRRSQNWNAMCADCHSIDVRRDYDADAARYRTRFAEISVGCESCHGPASRHIEWTRKASASDPLRGFTLRLERAATRAWTIDDRTGNARPQAGARSDSQLEVCAACHSRRAQFAEGWHAGARLMDHYLPATLSEGLYYPDGQQRDEVFTWGSFVQSRMHRAGVTCGDCHDPHSQALRSPGNAVCAQCHAPAKYDAPEHHHHRPDSTGAQCANCHMAPTPYMVVDPRRDHSFRIPRPDLAASLGTPDACTQCHVGRPPSWASTALASWGAGRRVGEPHFGSVLHDARRGSAGAAPALVGLITDPAQPAIVRATALGVLGRYPGPTATGAARRALGDADPLVRHAAIGALGMLAPERIERALEPVLEDPVRAVRLEAARVLLAVGARVEGPEAKARDTVVAEFEAVQRANLDRPEALLGLGNVLVSRNDPAAAIAAYRSALRLDPGFVPGYVNLAERLRLSGSEREAEATLRIGLTEVPTSAALAEALGLSLVRQGRHAEALKTLAAAHRAAPANARHAYVYALALKERGQVRDALRVLERAVESSGDRELRLALASLRSESGDSAGALATLRSLSAANPEDPALAALQSRSTHPRAR